MMGIKVMKCYDWSFSRLKKFIKQKFDFNMVRLTSTCTCMQKQKYAPDKGPYSLGKVGRILKYMNINTLWLKVFRQLELVGQSVV